jgi:hypothetical protein
MLKPLAPSLSPSLARPLPSLRAARQQQPTDFLSNLLVWLDPTYCTTVSGKIDSFTNRGSLGGTIAQATAAARSVLTASDARFNSLPSFAADGVGTIYPMPDLSALTEGEAFLVAVRPTDPSTANDGVWGKFGTYGQTAYLPYNDGNVYEMFGSASERPVNGNPVPSLASPFLYDVWTASNDYGIRINGTAFYSRGTNVVGFQSAPTFLGDPVGFWLGSVAHLLICGTKQTPTARAALEQWAKTTCGITAIP